MEFNYTVTPERYHIPYYEFALQETNTLIAGTVGSGKSTLVHGIIHAIMANCNPFDQVNGCRLYLADPKKVELYRYRVLPHTAAYADEPDSILCMLDRLIEIMNYRYEDMRKRGITKWDKGQIVLIIDELADLMTTHKAKFELKLAKIMQLSRAAGIHVIACTQSPARAVLPARSQILYTCKIGLKCATAIESRQAIGMPGCEKLPKYGCGIVVRNSAETMAMPMIPEDMINARIVECINNCNPVLKEKNEKEKKVPFWKRNKAV